MLKEGIIEPSQSPLRAQKSQKETCCGLLPDHKQVHSPGCLSSSVDRGHGK